MAASNTQPPPRTGPSPFPKARGLAAVLAWTAPLALLGACSLGGGGGGDGGMIGQEGDELPHPDGSGTFFNDRNEGGGASFLFIEEMFWGRLVDIHDVDATGVASPAPVFRDFVINENVQSDGQRFSLETNPVTQRTRLVILRTKGDPDDGTGTFDDLLRLAGDNLSPIQPMSDAPGALGPFSFIARNSALVVKFNDLLTDDEQALIALPTTVKVLTDYPPSIPYQDLRAFFDHSHGGLVESGGAQVFHATRVILDMTVSEADAASMIVPVGLNALGLPASLTTTSQANTAVRIPSRVDFASGQFSRLTNLAGHGVATESHGPVDLTDPTRPVVRAMRSGNPVDDNNGFLLDLNAPQLVGSWPITIDAVLDDPDGDPGFDFIVDLTFATPCASAPEPGNVVELPGVFAEVTQAAVLDGSTVDDARIRVLGDDPLSPAQLLGFGEFKRTYDATLFGAALEACWVSFNPVPGDFPRNDISPDSQIILRFSEPMDPATVLPFDTFFVTRVDTDPSPLEIIVGEVEGSGELKEFRYTPILPFRHQAGTPETYWINLIRDGGLTDLAGNQVVGVPEKVLFSLDATALEADNGGLVLRFSSVDEVKDPPPASGKVDIRGQFFYDFDRGVIKSRPVVRSAGIADRTQPVPGIMIPFALGVQTPLSPLGSRLMHVWRYVDVGFSSTDESSFNMDVEGLNWSPLGGQLVADFYDTFEIALSHSHYLPDEHIDPMTLLPTKPQSGLKPSKFSTNVLLSTTNPGRIVHPRSLGYTVDPLNLFLSSTGTFMMPYPLNTGGGDPATTFQYYTWRDTAMQEQAGPASNGIDLEIMVDVGLVTSSGGIAPSGQVPSIGLPLLMDYKCFPEESGVGLNSFDISLAVNTSRLPAFRVFSTGGVDSTGSLRTVNPDLDTPKGGFNPSSTPPGKSTPADDPSFYIGQIDMISRISRVHTIWLTTKETGATPPDFLDPVLEPPAIQQPQGTQLLLAFRGAAAVSDNNAYNADTIGPYGNIRDFTADFLGDNSGITFHPDLSDESWHDDIDGIDGALFIQVRFTFVGNPTTLLNSELSAFGVAWTR